MGAATDPRFAVGPVPPALYSMNLRWHLVRTRTFWLPARGDVLMLDSVGLKCFHCS